MPLLPYPVRIEKLAADEKPKHWYEYWVAGRGPFPYDMLRHDLCWPATSVDAAGLEPEERGQRAVKIQSYREPRIGRWESFGWRVVDAVLAESGRTIEA